MLGLRLLFGGMFLVGTCFAALAWIPVLLPIGIVIPQYRFGIRDTVMALTGSALAISGYFVWLNWLSFAIRERFYPTSGVLIQKVSSLNHLGWIVWFPFLRGTNIAEFFQNLPYVAIWICFNLAVAMFVWIEFASRRIDEEIRLSITRCTNNREDRS